jgi:hypothetical protein
MKRTIVIIKWIGVAMIILWILPLMAAFMSGLLFGIDDNLNNPEPESTHKIVEPTPIPMVISTPERHVPDHALTEESFSKQIPTPIPTTPQQFHKSESNTVPIPDDYYSQSCELPTDQSMQEYLSNSHWVEDYEENSWDCSQMAAYMEFMLENCGYNVVIREADVAGEQYGHAWILVEFKEGWLAYECTERYWVYPNEAVARSYDPYGYVYWNPSMYDAGVQYDTIYDVWEYCRWYSNGEEAFLQEYGWWIE